MRGYCAIIATMTANSPREELITILDSHDEIISKPEFSRTHHRREGDPLLFPWHSRDRDKSYSMYARIRVCMCVEACISVVLHKRDLCTAMKERAAKLCRSNVHALCVPRKERRPCREMIRTINRDDNRACRFKYRSRHDVSPFPEPGKPVPRSAKQRHNYKAPATYTRESVHRSNRLCH